MQLGSLPGLMSMSTIMRHGHGYSYGVNSLSVPITVYPAGHIL